MATASASLARNRTTLVLIFAMFVAPVVLAWLLANGYIDLPGDKRLNHGALISPPIDLRTYPDTPAMRALRGLPPADWAVVYVDPDACAEACARALRELAVIRTVIGNDGTRVSVFGLVAKAAALSDPKLPRILIDPASVTALGKDLASRGQEVKMPLVAFLDWRGQLMMHFPPDAPPGAIKEDLRRLLRASAIR
jgi:hypothetical protein